MFTLEHRPRLVGVVGSHFTSSPLGFEAENLLECDNPPGLSPDLETDFWGVANL